MQYIRLGRSGLKVSRLCLGAMTYGSPEWRPWVLPEEQSRPFIKRAIEAGNCPFQGIYLPPAGEAATAPGAPSTSPPTTAAGQEVTP